VSDQGIGALRDLAGEWELTVDLPGAPAAPDSCCVVIASDDGSYVQHYFDSRGVARLYAMTFDGRTWTLERTAPDFSPLDMCQRFVGIIGDDGMTISGEWQKSSDGQGWERDFGLTYTRHPA
jgi:hypothetical protein